MCCSLRASVYFLSSLHIFFSISLMVNVFPNALVSVGEKPTVSVLAFIYVILYFTSAFLVFRGTDEESATLIKAGAYLLFLLMVFRYTKMFFNIMLNPILPEAQFLYPYGTTVPLIFNTILYLFYLSVLFCYHNDLSHSAVDRSDSRSNSPAHRHHPMNYSSAGGNHSPNHLRQMRQSHISGCGNP